MPTELCYKFVSKRRHFLRMANVNDSGWHRILGLLAWLVTVALAAGLGAIASADSAAFYGRLERPSWAPFAGYFGPIWTLLYLLMALAAWLVWRERGFAGASTALTLFVLQLVLNALWSWLFFAWHLGGLAFLDVVLLAVLIAATMVAFWRIRPLAGVLLLPYLAWVLFAAALNYRIWQLNPQLLG
jgi:tryptophan-rich sensory protein